MTSLKRFCAEKRGNIAATTALLILPMILMAGGGLDVMRHETMRANLQDALDRGVLAAASLSQTMDPRETILSYLSQSVPTDGLRLDVEEKKTLNSRRVSATASFDYQTVFLKLAQIDSLTVPASSAAEEKRSNIELSLVLDISGSMVDNHGLEQLRPAADAFVDEILAPEVRNITSVNLIPFAGSVNVGSQVFDFMAGNGYVRRHTDSSCFELISTDFDPGLPDFPHRDQVPHFTKNNYEQQPKKQPWWCPTEDAAISYFSNDPTALKKKIDGLKGFDGTGTTYALKWASLLLDPTIRPLVKAGASYGYLPSKFQERPADYGDKDTMKFIVLMTDGDFLTQERPKDPTVNYQYEKNGKFRVIYDAKQLSDQYKKVCDAARNKQITVFTIAFEIKK